MIATQPVLAKISVLGLDLLDVECAIASLDVPPIIDERPEHRSKPPTVWFVSVNTDDVPLFVAGIWDRENEAFILRTAREADDRDIERWEERRW